jgi:hypothetical protein
MKKVLEDILTRCENGIGAMNRLIENNKDSAIVINRATYQLATLECFKKLAEEGLKKETDTLKKARKWDKLDEEISKYYEDDAEGDLCDIGEAAAAAFGYL